jgi:hypothetical protein
LGWPWATLSQLGLVQFTNHPTHDHFGPWASHLPSNIRGRPKHAGRLVLGCWAEPDLKCCLAGIWVGDFIAA